MSRLIEHFPSWMTGGGIFATLTNMPWSTDVPDATVLDMDYFGNHSGLRESSALVEKMCYDSEILSDTNITRLQNIIKAKYVPGWEKLYEALYSDYNPIENYRMEETATPDISMKHKVSADYQKKTETDAENESKTSRNSEVTSENIGSDSTSKVYGFNSSTGVNSDSIHTTGTSKTSADAADNYDETEGSNSGTVKETQTGYTEDTETGTRKLERNGNIGVTTSQQMIESEAQLRAKYNFFEQVYADVDQILTRGWYN